MKVLPKPEATATLVYPGRDLASTSAIFAGAITSPFEATGAARLPSGSFGDQGAVLVRLDGFPASVDYRAKALAKHLDDVAGPPEQVIRDEGHNSALWRDVRDATPLAETETDIWRLSIKPTDIQNLATIVSLDHMVIDWSGGLVWVASTPRTDLRARLINILGHATIIRSSDETKSRLGVFQTEPPQLAEMAKRLRQQFDPRGILNPGLTS